MSHVFNLKFDLARLTLTFESLSELVRCKMLVHGMDIYWGM